MRRDVNEICLTLPALRADLNCNSLQRLNLKSQLGTNVSLVWVEGRENDEKISFKVLHDEQNVLGNATFTVDKKSFKVSAKDISSDRDHAKNTASVLAIMALHLVNDSAQNKTISCTSTGQITNLQELQEVISKELNQNKWKLTKSKRSIEREDSAAEAQIQLDANSLARVNSAFEEEGVNYELNTEKNKHVYTFKNLQGQAIQGNMTIDPARGQITISHGNNEELVAKMVQAILVLHNQNPQATIKVTASSSEIEEKIATAIKAQLSSGSKHMVVTDREIKAEKREEKAHYNESGASYTPGGC